MHSELFTKGLQISKNHKKRSKKETEELYIIIRKAAELAQNKNRKESDKALKFLLDLYTPFISSISYNIYRKVQDTIEFEDVKQEVCYNFVILVNKYNKEKSEFSYYINNMLPQYMIKWINKEMAYNASVSHYPMNGGVTSDKMLDSAIIDENFLTNHILHNEYEAFILEKSKDKSKSRTNEEVCIKYFLGSETISDIADSLNISYHAVYQKVNIIKEELKEFFHHNAYCGYRITSTGIHPLVV